MTLAATTRQIFFNGNVWKSDAGLVEFYKHSTYLSFIPAEGYTIYPPLSALGQNDPEDHDEKITFGFKTHPYLSFPFKEGELLILVKNSSSKKIYSPPVLKLVFDTREQSEFAYKELVDRFTKLSTQQTLINEDDTKKAAFTDENAKPHASIGFWRTKGNVLTKGYIIWFYAGRFEN